MNKSLRLVALLMALVLCLSLAACGGKGEEETTTNAPDNTTDSIDVAAPTQEQETTAESTTAADEITTVADEPSSETTVADESSSAPETEAAGIAQPANTAEIVALFNNSANAVRTEKPGYVCNVTNFINKVTVHDSKALQRIADTALNFINADPSSETIAKGASHNSFGAPSTSYASALNASSVKNATCTKSGNTYKIRIDFKNETLADLPQDASKTNTGKAMPVLGAKDVYEQTDKIPGVSINKFAPTYTGCYIDCTVDATTGKMISCTYYWRSINVVEAKVLGMTAGADVDFAIQREYKFN